MNDADRKHGPGAGRNRLARETSPYLLQHASNPVDWYPWGDEALSRARAEDKPILLSVGYSACHWCHVMAHESFEDEDTARLMNELFVNVKVDREERPDIDEVYMTAVQLMTRHGGWPMTMFLTPEREPFFGGTYFPPADRHGLPSFRTVLRGVAEAWHGRRDELLTNARLVTDEIRRMGEIGGTPGAVDPGLLSGAWQDIAARFDPHWGGFGGAPKFPHTMTLSLCLRRWRSTGDGEALGIAAHSLARMAAGGIHDHLGGGFHRYSVDERWLVPHFEKMLYDNALLARLYLEAWQATGEPDLRATAEDILGYVRRDLSRPGGGFYSTEDADSEGHEGLFYVWRPGEVRAVLGAEDGELFCRVYGVSEAGNFEHGASILNLERPLDERAQELGLDRAELDRRLAAARPRLLEARGRRVRPGRDEKILSGWNGLMVDAMAFGARVLGSEPDLTVAVATGEFLWRELRRDGRFLHTFKDGEARIDAFLDDLAAEGLAFLSLWEATFEPVWIARAVELAEVLLRDFEDGERGGFFYGSARAESLVARTKNPYDNATPGGNSLAVHLLQRLHALTGEERWARSAERTLAAFRELMQRAPLGLPCMLEAAEAHLTGFRQVAIVGTGDEKATAALVAAASAGYDANRVVALAPAGAPPVELAALFRDRGAVAGRPTAWVCRGFTCDRPTSSPEELLRRMAGGPDAGAPV